MRHESRHPQAPLLAGVSMPTARPIVKWAGGKTQLLKVLTEALPTDYDRYVEPFLGGGALLLRLARPGSVAADSSEELMQFYETVRARPEELIEAVNRISITRDHYYRVRATAPQELDPVARAARFLYLNKTCYNGLYRVNRKGQFNTPFGRRTNVRVVDPDNLRKASNILRQTELRCADYRELLRCTRSGDFVYLDPPYLPLGGYSDFRRYTPHFFGHEDHVQLAQEFRHLTDKGVLALLSNSATPTVEELYDGFSVLRVKASRQINCKAEGRGRITELLIANFPLGTIDGIP